MKAEEIKDRFYTLESSELCDLLNKIKNDAESYGLNILDKESNTYYQDFIDLVLYNIDLNSYLKPIKMGWCRYLLDRKS